MVKIKTDLQKETISRPKLLLLTENYPPQRGGMAVSCDRIVRSLRDKSVIVDVAHFSRRYTVWKTLKKINGRHFNCPVREDVSDAINRLWNLVEKTHCEAGYTHIAAFGGFLPIIAAPVFAKWMSIPLITMIRGNDFDTGIFSLKRGDFLREALRNSAAVCAVSRDKVEKISRLYPDLNVIWTPNGIDPSDWEFSAEDRSFAENWRLENLEDDKKVLGFFGQLKRKKGGSFFLENLRRSGYADRFHLLFVGDIEDDMRNWLAENPEIDFTSLDFLDRFELLPFYAACDLVVLPSFYDGMPNVLLEAAALGIPFLASKTGGMRDVLEDGKNAVLFAPGDDYECRKAIERCARLTDEDFQKMKDDCTQIASKFDNETEADNYLQIFAETSDQHYFYAEK